MERRGIIAWAALMVTLCAACGSGSTLDNLDARFDAGPDASPADATPDLPEWSSDCPDLPKVRVVVVDAWGRSLPAFTLTVTPGSGAAPQQRGSTEWLGEVPFGVDLVAEAEAPDHAPAKVRAVLSTAVGVPVLEVLAPVAGSRWTAFTAASLGAYDRDGSACPRRTVYVGLDHLWLAAGGRAPSTNDVELYLSGETFWAAVYQRLMAPWQRVLATTWWWQSDFELDRPDGHVDFTEEQRRPRTMLALLEAPSAGLGAGGVGEAKVLINRFAEDTAGGMAYLNSDTEIRTHGGDPTSPIEVMLQGNPTPVPVQSDYTKRVPPPDLAPRVAANPDFAGEVFDGAESTSSPLETENLEAASYHQKAVMVDGRVAFIAGMNVKSTDWDTEEHAVFEPRRMKFQSTPEERHRVQQKLQLPDLGPRKDYGIRVEGPGATDADDVLRLRWLQGLDEGAMFAENASPFALLPRPDPWTPGVLAQVTPTMPEPIAEQSILETWTKALANAERFIYIEDQYFRMPLLDAVIYEAMLARPELTLIVVTKPITASDGGKKYTVKADHLYRDNFPDRYLMLQFKVFDAVPRYDVPAEGDETASFYFQTMDTHSKILIVDDVYLSVGSCNKNNRGVLYEGELNVAVLDPTWVRAERERIYRNFLGPRLAPQVSDDPLANFVLLRDTAAANAEVEAWWLNADESLSPADVAEAAVTHRPDGFAYPLTFTDDYMLEVGPDAF